MHRHTHVPPLQVNLEEILCPVGTSAYLRESIARVFHPSCVQQQKNIGRTIQNSGSFSPNMIKMAVDCELSSSCHADVHVTMPKEKGPGVVDSTQYSLES